MNGKQKSHRDRKSLAAHTILYNRLALGAQAINRSNDFSFGFNYNFILTD